MQIYLIGFMGSGKSYTGRQLAQLLNRRFIDLDDWIEQEAGLSIREIFEQQGEAHFRKAEAEAVRKMAEELSAVIATGGGTPCFHQNMEWMNANGLTVYLDTSPEVLFQRLKSGRGHRPLIRSLTDEGLRAYISQKLRERTPYYQQASIVYAQKTGGEAVAEDLAHQFSNITGH
ncbi:shikimate kinase [Phaeodactylibacter xiamenensis]|jgi:shikimate kinase|uniref:shikimate kinase n=1 Tax=Phaeodactylibacter xiamenensis TaxID=1524460 RepID=UPI0024A934E7|nr:shikimate kinase [Phaeodactylibacter xiamenensis]